MIKTFVTTTTALCMIAGVAFAQQTNPAAVKASDGTNTAVSSSATTQSASASSVNGTPGAEASTGATTSGQTGSMPAAPTMTSNMPAGDAPSAYPVCTKKGQDRCKQRRAM